MIMPLISVVIPAYNVELYIEDAIRSIMDQTYRNLEIIVIDDASTDNTYSILERLASTDNRIKIFKNSRNKRIAETLNFGIEQATGTYIARMDGDDISLPNKIEAQYNFLKSNPDIDLVGVNVVMVDEHGQTIHNEEYVSDTNGIIVASKYVSPVSHNWLAKTSVYRKIGKYRIASAEDLDFLLRCLDQGFKLYNLPDYLYLCRQRKGNTATSQGLTQVKSIAYIRKLQRERLKSAEMKDSYSEENLQKALNSTVFEKLRFEKSAEFQYKYFTYKNKSKIIAIFYKFLAINISPVHQLKPIYIRWRYKMIKQRIKRS